MKNVETKPFLGRVARAFRGIGDSFSETRRMQAEYRRLYPNILD